MARQAAPARTGGGKMAAERSLWVVGLCPGSRLGRVVRVLLLLLWFAARGGALYFHIGETEKKCFIEEIPDETMVIGTGEGREFSTRPRSWGGGGGSAGESCLQSRGQAASQCPGHRGPGATLRSSDWSRPASLQETTGRSCMTNSERSTSRPPLGLACSWRLKTQRIK